MLKEVVKLVQETGKEFLSRCFPEVTPDYFPNEFTLDKLKEAMSSYAENFNGEERSMHHVWTHLLAHNEIRSLMVVAVQPGVFPEGTLRRLAYRFVTEAPISWSPTGTLAGLLQPEGPYAKLLRLCEECLKGDKASGAKQKQVRRAMGALPSYPFPSWAAKVFHEAILAAATAASCTWGPRTLLCASRLPVDFILLVKGEFSEMDYVTCTHVHMMRQLDNPFPRGDRP